MKTHLGSSGKEGMLVSVGHPSTVQIDLSWFVSSFPGNRGLPVKSSAKIQPTLHMSTSGPYFVAPSRSSGGLQTRLLRLIVIDKTIEK